MRNLPWIGAGVLGGIAVGLLVGFLIWAGASQPVARQPLPDIAAPADRPGPAAPDSTIAAPRAAVPAEQAPATATPAAAIPPVVHGDGVLDGVVKLSDGTPLSNFTFGLRPASYLYQRTSAELNRMSADEQIAEAARRIRWTEAATLMTTTNQDGTFRLDGLVRSPSLEQYYFSRVPDGFRLGIRSGAGSSGIRAGQTLEIVATRRVLVELRVVEGGELLPQALVQGVPVDWEPGPQGGTPGYDRWTRESPLIEVSPGSIRFHARSPSDSDASATQIVEVPAEGLGHPIELHLARPRGIYIKLHAPPGYIGYSTNPMPTTATNPTLTHECYAFTPSTYSGDISSYDARMRGVRLSAQWGSDYFTYTNPPAGRYIIVVLPASSGGHSFVLATQEVEIGDETVYADIHLPEQHERDHIVLRAWSPAGEPVREGLRFEVVIHSLASGRSNRRTAPFSNRGDGSWWTQRDQLVAASSAFGMSGPMQHPSWAEIEAHHSRYGAVRVRYDFATGASLDVRFEEPAKLVVKVEGMTDEDNAMLVLAIADSDANLAEALARAAGSSRAGQSALATGTQEFSPLAPGPKVIVLGRRLQLTGSASLLLVQQSVVLMPGDNTVTLRVPRLHSLAVNLEPPIPGTLSLVQAEGGWSSIRMSRGEDGLWRADSLPAGEYIIRIQSRGEARISVPSVGTVTPEFRAFNGWRVTALDRQNIAIEKGLRYYDHVVALNGERHEGTEALSQALRQAEDGANVTLTVEREGRSTIITFTADEFRRARNDGLSLHAYLLP